MIRRRFIRTVFASVAGLLGLPACRPRMPLQGNDVQALAPDGDFVRYDGWILIRDDLVLRTSR